MLSSMVLLDCLDIQSISLRKARQIDRFLTNNQLPKNLEESRSDFYAITAERRLRNLWSWQSPGTPMRRSFRIRSMILVPH
jgi:hypothetical protein